MLLKGCSDVPQVSKEEATAAFGKMFKPKDNKAAAAADGTKVSRAAADAGNSGSKAAAGTVATGEEAAAGTANDDGGGSNQAGQVQQEEEQEQKVQETAADLEQGEEDLEDDISEVDEKEKKPVAVKQSKAKGRPQKGAVAAAASKVRADHPEDWGGLMKGSGTGSHG
jgi:hypothetical protein